MKCYLCFAGVYSPEYEAHRSIEEAKEEFLRVARQLDNYGQRCEASIHIADLEELVNEYPDFVLSLTSKGNLKCERT